MQIVFCMSYEQCDPGFRELVSTKLVSDLFRPTSHAQVPTSLRRPRIRADAKQLAELAHGRANGSRPRITTRETHASALPADTSQAARAARASFNCGTVFGASSRVGVQEDGMPDPAVGDAFRGRQAASACTARLGNDLRGGATFPSSSRRAGVPLTRRTSAGEAHTRKDDPWKPVLRFGWLYVVSPCYESYDEPPRKLRAGTYGVLPEIPQIQNLIDNQVFLVTFARGHSQVSRDS
ncbi:hypothetical protein HPB47_000375 [Ixodes persulcatus]|uniref:Uncharacterized protein n=1 Tax=Ixodes persulcatus TaxID=34615 RepID=A0AC60PSQ5_IXOPE|nr:hypothetical protein HPB47_000375 [Ixodes persulcatus]